MTPQNLGLLFKATALKFPDKRALGHKQNGLYRWLTWSELSSTIDSVASAFLKKGLTAGDRIAILSENRPEWVITDLAAQSIGMVTVPIYTSLAPAEIRYILNDSGCKALAVSNKELLAKIVPIHRSLGDLSFVLGFNSALSLEKSELAVPLHLMKEFETTLVDGAALKAGLHAVSSETLCSIIYTSGTTGTPKGVMLTHSNFIQNVLASAKTLKMSSADVHLSFLPLCHVFERMAGYYLMVHLGAEIAYAESLDTVPQNMIEVRPTFLLGVPRFYEKTRDRVLEAVKQASGPRRKLFNWAIALGEKKRLGLASGLLFRCQTWLAERLVTRKFRARLGGRIRFCISGGAALPRQLAEFFYDLSVIIYEGYGLTETSPVMTVNREGRFRFGTVGLPLENVSLRIEPDGEVLTAGPCVMKGYWNKPDETREALKDGWFHTGDLGCVDPDGFLAITGRKKELIVTSGGKKISPRPIEEALETDPHILRCVLFGEGRKFLTALIVPKREKLLEFARLSKLAFKDYTNLLKNEAVTRFYEGRIASGCADLANFEKIKYFLLLEDDFSQSAGELTPTLKVKRQEVWSKYGPALERFYASA